MGTHYDGRPEEVRALDAYIKLMRAADSVSERASRHLAGSGLTLSQFGALEALFHRGPLCQRDLGRKILRSGANVVMVVDNLEKRGLAVRRRNGEDRRFVSVSLTAKGRRLIRKVFSRHVREIVREFRVLAPDEQELMGRLCRRLGLGLDGRNAEGGRSVTSVGAGQSN